MDPKRLIEDAKRTGRLWLTGEMEIPFPCYFRDAVRITNEIAEACGYVAVPRGSSMLEISGGNLCGYVVLDWFHGDRLGPAKVEFWSSVAAYADIEQPAPRLAAGG